MPKEPKTKVTKAKRCLSFGEPFEKRRRAPEDAFGAFEADAVAPVTESGSNALEDIIRELGIGVESRHEVDVPNDIVPPHTAPLPSRDEADHPRFLFTEDLKCGVDYTPLSAPQVRIVL